VVFLATTYDPNELIRKNAETANTLASQTSQPNAGGSVGKLTGDVLNVLEPVRRQQENRINQQYNTSKRSLQENLAATGGYRSGNTTNQMIGLEQARNQQLADANAGHTQTALSQALAYAQLPMQEAALTGQYNGQQTLVAQQLAQQAAQNEFANQLAAAGLTGQYGGQQTLSAQQLAAQLAAQEAALTGQYKGQQTLPAQQLAAQIAALTGEYNGQQTLDAINQQKQQELAQLQALLSYNLGVGGVTDSLPQPTGFNYGDAMIKLLKSIYGL
jgi:uncharacterized protein YaaQ